MLKDSESVKGSAPSWRPKDRYHLLLLKNYRRPNLSLLTAPSDVTLLRVMNLRRLQKFSSATVHLQASRRVSPAIAPIISTTPTIYICSCRSGRGLWYIDLPGHLCSIISGTRHLLGTRLSHKKFATMILSRKVVPLQFVLFCKKIRSIILL